MNEELLELNDELFQEGYLTGRGEGFAEGYAEVVAERLKAVIKQSVEEGIKKGKILMVMKLYFNGVITDDQAMDALEVNEEEFSALISKYKA
ncbi:MAG: hypothetical protein SPL80_02080 [Bacilli bacterium]|nr:hypothetical protein [Bacilli bacterium]